ncbi:MAG: PAS domain-containing protein [Firmicutes bacterium]|nr:PAS domain-containing protein [Alicyclobacillaceae bacterium]MCL6497405.1 PAS domain-containing protein [Bacillota bacterium]
MPGGALWVDASGVVRYLNAAGAALLGVQAEEIVGRPYEVLAAAVFPDMLSYLRQSAIPLLLQGGRVPPERRLTLPDGRTVLVRQAALTHPGSGRGVVVTFMDVTALVQAELKARAAADEVERAFGLTLPNSKVEAKLKASPEYRDRYDPVTGRARVLEVIPDGTYRHVINGLRILADLNALGVFQLVGFDKDTLVQAFIFHDVGKEQPVLTEGQEFVPRETFEPSPLHAVRSADWARAYYGISEAVEQIIRYHHTPEAELPATFPSALRPMWRLFQVVDGLSAAVTRRDAVIRELRLEGTRLWVWEDNPDPRYRQRYALALYSGQRTALEAGAAHLGG